MYPCIKGLHHFFFQKRTHKKKPKVPYQEAQTAQEAIQKIIQEKKISSKINYDVLNDLTFNASSMKSSSNKGDNPGEVDAASAAAATHPVTPILENRASTLLRLKKVNSSAHLEVSVNHAGYLNLTHHTREPLYSKGAVIAWWLQSTSAQNSVQVIFW